MNSRSTSRFSRLFATLALLPVVASAHPGHDGGHGLTWDFAGGFGHAEAALGVLFILGMAVFVMKLRGARSVD